MEVPSWIQVFPTFSVVERDTVDMMICMQHESYTSGSDPVPFQQTDKHEIRLTLSATEINDLILCWDGKSKEIGLDLMPYLSAFWFQYGTIYVNHGDITHYGTFFVDNIEWTIENGDPVIALVMTTHFNIDTNGPYRFVFMGKNVYVSPPIIEILHVLFGSFNSDDETVQILLNRLWYRVKQRRSFSIDQYLNILSLKENLTISSVYKTLTMLTL